MNIFPAIDLYDGKAVRLYKGDYAQMTVYSENPAEIAVDFAKKGAKFIHVVDLEGAKTGETPNLACVLAIKEASGLFCEIGGGIRSMEVIDRYLGAGIDRVILGTAAVADRDFVRRAVAKYGDRIAVGADVKDGFVAVKGWTETTALTLEDFCADMQSLGVSTVICTDISKDGAMMGTNLPLYHELSKRFSMRFVASGGVSTIEDVRRLSEMKLYGAIIGKAYYTGSIDLAEAIEVAK
ncbi:MAG: 1-(5-phosphoribosyl)-5-[Clostridia bacterium]|nr:1-(5-phosphoribosyl)-5-[(5-phosphoribosylamino)methylideneamino]imidazole-4-carboxamide isomerase [Clostridia bacterium]MBQ9774340.1 1-(5-phosphoribosyl)-5-[(5-phosphoribosylamino)methylideneamino]imidazole-4-carboxamide isomerase [Clostridia bacterium]